MVRHVVMWKLKEEALGLKKSELARSMTERLEALVGKVSEIKFFQVGRNHDSSDTAPDLVLVSDFADFPALKRYAEHPEHLKVVDFVKQVIQERRVVDFEFS